MLINKLLPRIQEKLYFLYNNSSFLKNIDLFIGVGIVTVIFFSAFANSDLLGNVAMLVILLTFIKFLTVPRKILSINLSEKFLLLYLMLVVISVFGSSLFSLSLKGFFKTLIYIGFYISVVDFLMLKISRVKYLFLAIIAVMSLESIVAFLQNFSCVEEISGWQDVSRLNPEEVMTRVYGTLKPYNPNLFGGFLLACLPSFLTLFFVRFSSVNQNLSIYFAAFGFLVGTIALFLTGCRGAYIGFFVLIL